MPLHLRPRPLLPRTPGRKVVGRESLASCKGCVGTSWEHEASEDTEKAPSGGEGAALGSPAGRASKGSLHLPRATEPRPRRPNALQRGLPQMVGKSETE